MRRITVASDDGTTPLLEIIVGTGSSGTEVHETVLMVHDLGGVMSNCRYLTTDGEGTGAVFMWDGVEAARAVADGLEAAARTLRAQLAA
jgi:hypothetical protein